MKKFNNLFFLLILFSQNISIGQVDSLETKSIELSGYVETFYMYDLANPVNHSRPDFFYSYNRHNEFNLNIGLIKLAYENERVRGNLALMTGTYPRANLAHEPAIYRIINQANVSYQIFKEKNTWFTAGVFPSHIGFESAVGADCWNLTRSILAENSPYYLSGAKLYSTSKNEKWTLGFTVTNGWQRIQRQAGNQLVGLGHQLTYNPTEKLTLNSSSYIGSEFPDSTRRMRYFHDLYAIAKASEKLSFIVGFDVGFEQTATGASTYNTWYSPILLTRYHINSKLSVSGRLEHYSDQSEVIISTATGNGFSTIGYSINLDFHPTNRLMWRIEARSLRNQRNIYITENGLSNVNTVIGSSLSIRL